MITAQNLQFWVIENDERITQICGLPEINEL